MNVVPDESDIAVTPPELSCETLAELVLVDVASPDPEDAVEVPVFVPEFMFVALPPVFPVELPDESPSECLPPMLPPLADPSAHWWLWFSPVTVESALLSPELAVDSWSV
ncbi:MAG TPA: hypothetical protein VL119_07650 [Acidimicrobiia bacterium]|nr:hypothetical protein [Acidimicrobiia bacterium]